MTQSTVGPVASADTPAAPRPIGEVVREVTTSHINRLQKGYQDNDSFAVAALARIRRGAGKPVNAVPDLWGLTGTEPLYEHIDEKKRPDDLARAENAVHIAVTLWALHQQSRRDARMHVPGGPQLGSAVRALMPSADELDEPIWRRFVRVGTATSLDVLAQRLREIVLLLRQAGQPMDYGALAEQLYRWQQPGGRSTVHRVWGRNFHARRPADPPTTPPVTNDKETS